MRTKLLFLHRWLGLTAGTIFAIASATGAVLIYQSDLDRLIGGPRFETTEGSIDASVLEAAIMRERPNGEIRGLTWLPDENVVRANVRDDNLSWSIFLDAGSGQVVQQRGGSRVLAGIRRLHTSLLIGRIGGKLVTYASAAALVSLTIGIFLWWPGIRKLWVGFRVRWNRGAYLLNFDLHQSLGILALPLLLMATATGVLMPYGRVTDRIERVVHGPRQENGWGDMRSTTAADPAARTSVAALVERARTLMPDARLTSLELPASADGVVEARFESDDSDAVLMALDRQTGSRLATRPAAVPYRFDRAGVERLHVARVGGAIFRALYMVSCVVGFVLLPTGVVVWWIKRERLAAAAKRRENGSGAGV